MIIVGKVTLLVTITAHGNMEVVDLQLVAQAPFIERGAHTMDVSGSEAALPPNLAYPSRSQICRVEHTL